MNMLRSLLQFTSEGSQSSNRLAKLFDTHKPLTLSHHTNIARWHTDCRPPVHIVLLHGLYSSGNVFWNEFIKAVNDLPTTGKTPKLPMHLYALDLRDHGRSPHSQGGFELPGACADVRGFLKGPLCEGQKVFMVGHGIGGYIASVIGMACPSLVAGVAALNTNLTRIHDNLHQGTLLALESGGNGNRSRSGREKVSVDAMQAKLDGVLRGSERVADVSEKLKSVFMEDAERESFLSSAITAREGQDKMRWKCNMTGIAQFDAQRSPNELDALLRDGSVRNDTLNYLHIRDASGSSDNKEEIQSLLPKAKTFEWENFGGVHAETSMVLRQPSAVVRTVLQHFRLLDDM